MPICVVVRLILNGMSDPVAVTLDMITQYGLYGREQLQQQFPPAYGSASPDRFYLHRYSSRSPASASPSLQHQGKSGTPASSTRPV